MQANRGRAPNRRIRWGAIALVGVFAWALPARASAPGDLPRLRAGATLLHDLPVGDGAALRAEFYVHAPEAIARAVLWDAERFPEFMPGSRAVRLLSRGPTHQLAAMRGGAGPLSVAFVIDRRLEARRIVWHAVSGDLARNDGLWAFAPTAGGTLVTYQVHVTPRGPVPGGVVGYLQKQALPAMVRAVRERIEHQAARARTGRPGASPRP